MSADEADPSAKSSEGHGPKTAVSAFHLRHPDDETNDPPKLRSKTFDTFGSKSEVVPSVEVLDAEMDENSGLESEVNTRRRRSVEEDAQDRDDSGESGSEDDSEEDSEQDDSQSQGEKVVQIIWVQCDSCSKWRKLDEETKGLADADTFVCKDLKGITCDTEEAQEDEVETTTTAGRGRDRGSARASGSGRGRGGKKRGNRGWGSNKRQVTRCAKCGDAIERWAAGKERHYRTSPSCRPIEETTPNVVAKLVLDLSDRLPFRAVVRKDMRMWDKFTARTKACDTYPSVAKQLLWLYRQLKQSVFDSAWGLQNAQSFREDCENCSGAAQAVQLVQSLEMDAIDWNAVYDLWNQERSQESSEAVPSKPASKKRRHASVSARQRTANARAARKRKRSGMEGSDTGGNQETANQDDSDSEDAASKAGDSQQAEASMDDENVSGTSVTVNDGEPDVKRQKQEPHGSATEDASSTRRVSTDSNLETREKSREVSNPEDSEDSESTVETFTLGTILEINLDDGELGFAIVSHLPTTDDSRYTVTFLDDEGNLSLADTLQLQLPNEFVDVVFPNSDEHEVPRGWIPVPFEQGTCFVGPNAEVCYSLEEIANRTW